MDRNFFKGVYAVAIAAALVLVCIFGQYACNSDGSSMIKDAPPANPGVKIDEANKDLGKKAAEIRDSGQDQLKQVAAIRAQNPPPAISKPNDAIGAEAEKIIANANGMIGTLSAKLEIAKAETDTIRNELITARGERDILTKQLQDEKDARKADQERWKSGAIKIVVIVGGLAFLGMIGLGIWSAVLFFNGGKGAMMAAAGSAVCGITMAFSFAVSKHYDKIADYGLYVLGGMVAIGFVCLVIVLTMFIRRKSGLEEVVKTNEVAKRVIDQIVLHAQALADKPVEYTKVYLEKLTADIKAKIYGKPEDGITPGVAYHIQSPTTERLVASIREKIAA